MRRVLAAVLPAAFLFAGCIGTVKQYYEFDSDDLYVNPGVFPGTYEPPGADGSFVLNKGFLKHGEPEVYKLRSQRSAAPMSSAPSESEKAVYITMAVWKPIDFTYNGTIPIIVDAGPYYEIGTICAVPTAPGEACPPEYFHKRSIKDPGQMTPFLLMNFLPKGYAVAQIAVRGTGTSGGCMEFMGPNEAADLNQAINFLAEQDWSNGNVSMIGGSYDGSTPWMVAALGNEHLKTIVPISGLADPFDLMFRNGSAEWRAPIIHPLYWNYGLDNDRWPRPFFVGGNNREPYQDRQNIVCPEAYEGFAMADYSTIQGDRGTQVNNFWAERDWRGKVIANYKGSVFFVHGLQDWNVDPHVAIPFNARLKEAGIEVKEWYGQWGHATPDSGGPGSSCFGKEGPVWLPTTCRWDFAETLDHWFEYYLKGNASVDRGAWTQVMGQRGHWRVADSFPPSSPQWLEWFPTREGQLRNFTTSAQASSVLLPPRGVNVPLVAAALPPALRETARSVPLHYLEFKTDPLENDTLLTGLPQLHVRFEAMSTGGFLAAWLFDENAEGKVLDMWTYDGEEQEAVPRGLQIIGHANMDLRYHAGGETRVTPVPRSVYTARMEFEPMETLIPKGHRLTLWLFQYQSEDRLGGTQPAPVKVLFGGGAASTVLRVPTQTIEWDKFFPVPGQFFPDAIYYERLHVKKPFYEQTVPPPNGEPVARDAEETGLARAA